MFCLVYVLFLLIILTSDMYAVLNCPVWGSALFFIFFFCLFVFFI